MVHYPQISILCRVLFAGVTRDHGVHRVKGGSMGGGDDGGDRPPLPSGPLQSVGSEYPTTLRRVKFGDSRSNDAKISQVKTMECQSDVIYVNGSLLVKLYINH